MRQKPFEFCKNPCIYKASYIFYILILILQIVFLFEIKAFEGLALAGSSKEPIGVKFKDGEVKIKEFLVKEKSLQTGRFNNEKLSYDIYWLGIYVGNAVLEASNDKNTLQITSRINSASFISAFYKVEDYAESLIRDGRAIHFRIKQQEGRYRSDKETLFDISNKKVTYFDYLKSRKKEHSTDSVVWDVISGFYYLRTLPLVIGKVIYIDVFDSNKFLKAEVSVLRKEKVKVSGIGEVATVVVKPDLKSEGLFHRKGDIFIWLTDDEKRIPVKVETKVPIGKIVAELKF